MLPIIPDGKLLDDMSKAQLAELLRNPLLCLAFHIVRQSMQPNGEVMDPIVGSGRAHQLSGANEFVRRLVALTDPTLPEFTSDLGQWEDLEDEAEEH